MNKITISKTKRKNDMALYENFIYHKHSENNGLTRWRCVHRTCQGSIFTDSENSVVTKNMHNHTNDQNRIQKMVCLENIKEKTLHTKDSNNDIIVENISTLTENVIEIMPKLSTIRDEITRKRNKITNFKTVYDDIPEAFKKTLRGEKFLQYDSGLNDKSRIVVFFFR